MRLAVNGRFLAARATGVQRVATELVARLPSRIDVTVHLPRGVRAPAPEAVGRVRSGLSSGPLWEQLELPWRRARDGYDVALDPANAGPRFGRRRVLVLHDVFPVTNPEWYGPAFRAWFSGAVAPSARRADRVVTFTRWAADRAVEALGLDPARIRVIGQGVEPFDDDLPEDAVQAVRARFGLPRRFALATGGGDTRKNLAFLHDLLPRLPGLPIVIVGRGYDHVQRPAGPEASGAPAPDGPAGGEPVARGRRAPPGVHRLGHVSDAQLRALYRAATVFCFPSLAEGFGRPPLEAMASGTPVVTADYGAAAEVLGDAAVRLPLDPDAWVEAVARLAEDGPARRDAVARGRLHAAGHRWDDAAAALAAVCDEVADASRRVRVP